jgi:putative DNA primase/helicase
MLYNDSYNASLFVEMFKDKIRWCRDLGGWFIYNDRYWECDRNGYIKHYAIKVYERMLSDLRTYPVNNEQDQKNLDLFSRHVKATGNDGKLDSMLECAKPYLGHLPEMFDANPSLFNCNNITIDLDNKKVNPFRQDDLLTKSTKVDWIKDATCPTWEKFIDDIFLGNEELIDFVQRSCGYSMTTSTKEQCLFILYGEGRNGKTVFIEIMRQIFGDYSSSCASTTLIRKNNEGIPNDIAALRGARLVTAVESNENVTLDEQVVKKLTGTDTIRARFLNKEFFDFIPTFKIFMATNHKPNIRGTDTGIWRRIRLIPFNFRVTEATDDKNLLFKLREELPGILNWVLAGYKRWHEHGLQPPKEIWAATDAYRDEEDDLGQFIDDYCVIDDKEAVPLNFFKMKFKEVNGYFKSQKTIREYMLRKGFKEGRPYIKGNQVRCYMGLRLLTPWEA